MSQLIFKFPFKTTYKKKDFFVASNNFEAYKLIESWPHWPNKWINIIGPSGCGKTHLSKILMGKIKLISVNAEEFNDKINNVIDTYDCVVIENYNNNINENLLYSSLNHYKQLNKNVLINSANSVKQFKVNLKDLKSRLNSFLDLYIDLPSDELIRVIILKSFSDKQIIIDKKNLEYVLKNIERSYEKVLKFIKDIDNISLSTGKSININLIKKVLMNE